MSRREFRWIAALIVLGAFALRMFYVLDVKTTGDIRGDINDYVSYAWNLHEAGVFSSSPPGSGEPSPDSYRGPGYPMFLAAFMRLSGPFRFELRDAEANRLELLAVPSTWILFVYCMQAILGALTAGLGIWLARFWLGDMLSLGAGLAIALWPHLIVFCATLLSETLLGFLLTAALVATCLADQRRTVATALAAGVLFAMAYLVNPVVGAFPAVAAILLARSGRFRTAMFFLAAFALAPITWTARNHIVDVGDRTSLMRAEQNFVEGSWPQLHVAINTRFTNDISAAFVKATGDEEAIFLADPTKGIAMMSSRMAEDPAYYLRWYFVEKPLLLWDWRIRVGASDISFLRTTSDPFSRQPLSGLKAIFEVLNPAFTALAFASIVGVLVRKRLVGTRAPFACALCLGLFIYVTMVHDVFQAEPRYAIPYRAVEVVIALSSIGLLTTIVARYRKHKEWQG
jgi:hypothetical protein